MILGEGVRLRAPERSDLPGFVKWLNDPEVREWLLLYKPISHVGEEKWFEEMLKRPPDEHVMVIEAPRDGDWIAVGNCGMHRIDWRSRVCELGIFIGEKSYWNQGIGTRVMGLLLKHGFETLNLNRIFLEVFEDNKRAIRAYEKAGFVHEGRKRQAIYKGGHYTDILIMSVLRSEWFQSG